MSICIVDMAGFILRDWQPGDVVTAEGFSQLVAAVRGLLAGCGVQPGRRYAARRWRFFVPAGAAVLWRDAAGEPRAWMNDVLWQVGPFVKVLPGGEVADLKKAMGKAAGEAAVGVHGELEVVEHGDMEGWTLEATGAEYAAAAWVILLIPFARRFWRAGLCTLLAIVLSLGINAGLQRATNAKDGSKIEMLSVPIQQLSRARLYAPEFSHMFRAASK